MGVRRSCVIASRAAARSGASSSNVELTKTRTRWSGVRITWEVAVAAASLLLVFNERGVSMRYHLTLPKLLNNLYSITSLVSTKPVREPISFRFLFFSTYPSQNVYRGQFYLSINKKLNYKTKGCPVACQNRDPSATRTHANSSKQTTHFV